MVTGSQSLHVSCYTCILKLFMCILPWQTYCSKVAKARLCTGRCMAMLQSYPTTAHPYPSLLSALSKSVLLHQTVAIMILGLWTCQDRVDRLVNIHSCLRYTCISLCWFAERSYNRGSVVVESSPNAVFSQVWHVVRIFSKYSI